MSRLAILASVLAVGLVASAQEKEVNEATVREATTRAVEYLYSRALAKGIWDKEPAPAATNRDGKETASADSLLGGKTSLVLAALALAGEEKDPRFQKALAWLMTQQTRGTYATGLRLVLFRSLTNVKDYGQAIRRDAAYLQSGARTMKDSSLMWSYLPPPSIPSYAGGMMGDYSNVNYAVLGLWAASDLKIEVPQRHWQGLERTWTQGQHEDGGWGYFPVKDVTPQMSEHYRTPRGSLTAAGVASLYVIIDQRYAGRGEPGAFRESAAYKSIQSGLKWLGDNFDSRQNPGRPQFASYYFYNCERVGAAAGMKYFGTHDWFREIAATILRVQRPDGSIPLGMPETMGGAMVDTAFSLMFLAKGSANVIMNKLQHAGDWDNHPRDVAIMTEWFAHASERPANWQVVNLTGPAEDLSDSRILLISGTQALSFTEEDRAKIKRYVDLGGLLVFHPDANAEPFQDSTKKLLAELWPNLEITKVDIPNHPLGTFYLPLKAGVAVRQLASPTRVLAFVLEGAPAEAWEKRLTSTQEWAFDLAADLSYFSMDLNRGEQPPSKLTFFAELFRQPMSDTERSIPLARIRYGPVEHRWNPEPLAFENFARRLANDKKINCEIKVVAPAELAGCGAKVAHLTGIDAVEFSAEESNAIQAFIRGGGTLIVDQAGGFPVGGRKETFHAAFRRQVEAWFGPDALQPLGKDHPLTKDIGALLHRNVEGLRRKRMPPVLAHVVLDGRSVLYYSRSDLTCGLLGNPNPMVSGLDADGAYEVFQRLFVGSAPKPAQ